MRSEQSRETKGVFRFAFRSVRGKVTAAILLTALLIASLFLAVFLPVRAQGLKAAKERARNILTYVANRDKERLANELFEHRLAAVRLRLSEMMAASGVLHVSVYDAEGELLASRGVDAPHDRLDEAQREAARFEPVLREDTLAGEPVLQYTGPIDAFGEAVGYLRMCYSMSDMQRTASVLLLLFGSLFFVVLACLVVFLNYLLDRSVTRPIRRLAEAMGGVAEGEFSLRVEDLPPGEIGALGTAFNHMAERIESQRAEIRRAEEDYREIFNNASEGLFRLSPDKGFLSANPAMAAILGYASPEELMNLGPFVPEGFYANAEDRPRLLHAAEQAGGARGFEAGFLKKDGQLFWASLSVRAVKGSDGALAYYEGSLADVSDRKVREDAERERQAALNLARAKGEFLARMSHEIRTPINAILGLTHLAAAGEADPDKRRMLDAVQNAGRSLLRIINDILDLSKIEAGKLTLERVPFSLDEILGNLAMIICPAAEEKGLETVFFVDPALPGKLLGDPLRLGQILNNLAGNAVKFTSRGEISVSVSLEGAGEGERLARFTVADTGPGLTPEEIKRLFEDYSQADPSISRKFGGTGLGLSISRDLARMMGGAVEVVSTPGEGSVFSFLARFGLPEEQAPAALRDISGRRILIADASALAARALAGIAASFGLETAKAQDAPSALKLLRAAVREERPFDAVFVAHALPGDGARDLLTRLTADPVLFHTRGVLLTPCLGPGKEMDFASAASALCGKPVLRASFYRAMLQALAAQPAAQPCRAAMGGETVPAAAGKPKIERKAPAAPPPAQGPRGRILVVEDNPVNRMVAEGLLKSHNVQVLTAPDGQSALDLLGRETVDLVFMDIQMPGLDGLETTRRIRAMGKTMPIVAMTAQSMEEDRIEAREAGMDDFLAKPVDPEALKSILANWLPGASVKGGRAGAAVSAIPAAQARTAPDGLDAAAALNRLGGDESVYRELLGMLRRESLKSLAAIREGVREDDLEKVRQAAHFIKGSAANLGAGPLSDAARAMEQAARNGDKNAAQTLFADFEKAVAAYIEAQRAYRAAFGEKPGDGPPGQGPDQSAE